MGLSDGALAWGDYDNDGRLDLVVAGLLTAQGSAATWLYHYDGNDVFSDSTIPLPGLGYSALAWGDYDNDGRLDLAIAGSSTYQDSGGSGMTRIYRNGAGTANTPPAAPGGLAVSEVGRAVTLSWSPASDNETPAAGLSYNLRVGTAPGADDVFTGMADFASGLRRVPATGNAQKRLSWTLSNLAYSRYYASVQAIDTAFAGSPWTVEQAVVVPAATDYDTDGDVDLVDFRHFRDCFNGPNRAPLQAGCSDADSDSDNDVDLVDFRTFQDCFNGPNRPPSC